VTRIKVIVEGQTEESFIRNVLSPVLWSRDIYVTPILLGVPGHKGGNVNFARVKKDITLHLKQDPAAYCSTMLDLYGLGEGFPGLPPVQNQNGVEKAQRIEQAIYDDILATIPECRPDLRFYPYLQVHEFEGLLFSDPDTFAEALGKLTIAPQLHEIRNAFATPEDINDSPMTAPSKRVINLYGSYRKTIEGTIAAQAVGIHSMRQQCPHFHSWVSWLEAAISFAA
jgi:Domain of unknown function (DUF4276)